MPFDVIVTDHGPFFDGQAEAAVVAYARHVEQKLGDVAVSKIRAYLPTQYMYLGHHGGTPEFNPVPPDAGALAASVHTERAVEDGALIVTDRVTYGPWIEGVSALNAVVWPHYRNPPPRRFPGYHSFRLIAQELQIEAADIAQAEIAPYLTEMN